MQTAEPIVFLRENKPRSCSHRSVMRSTSRQNHFHRFHTDLGQFLSGEIEFRPAESQLEEKIRKTSAKRFARKKAAARTEKLSVGRARTCERRRSCCDACKRRAAKR